MKNYRSKIKEGPGTGINCTSVTRQWEKNTHAHTQRKPCTASMSSASLAEMSLCFPQHFPVWAAVNGCPEGLSVITEGNYISYNVPCEPEAIGTFAGSPRTFLMNRHSGLKIRQAITLYLHSVAGNDLVAVPEPCHLWPREATDHWGVEDGSPALRHRLSLVIVYKVAHICKKNVRGVITTKVEPFFPQNKANLMIHSGQQRLLVQTAEEFNQKHLFKHLFMAHSKARLHHHAEQKNIKHIVLWFCWHAVIPAVQFSHLSV